MSGSLVFFALIFFFFFFAPHLYAVVCCSLPSVLEVLNERRGFHWQTNQAEVSLWIHEARLNIWDQRGQDESLFKK